VGSRTVPSIGVAKCSTPSNDDGHFGFAWRDCCDVVECVGIDFRQFWRMADHSSMGAKPHDEIYLEVATTLVTFLLAGRYFEVRSRRRAGAALRSLLNIGSQEATLWRDGVETLIPIGALGVGEIFMVRPGETIATDGVVVVGQSDGREHPH
jgi:cation transport ATPase